MECPQIHQMHSYGFTTLDKVRSYIDVLLNEYKSEKFRTLAIAEKSSNKLIGSITIDVMKFFSRAELSYWINKDYRNAGYATETVKAIIQYCVECLSFNRVQAITSNAISERVLDKAGMMYEGTLRQYFGSVNSFSDCKMYAVLKSDFEPK
jgi:ribosomal-protein-alanine N-acetyltransferase